MNDRNGKPLPDLALDARWLDRGPDLRNPSECRCCHSSGPQLRRWRRRGAFRGELLCLNCRLTLSIEESDRETHR